MIILAWQLDHDPFLTSNAPPQWSRKRMRSDSIYTNQGRPLFKVQGGSPSQWPGREGYRRLEGSHGVCSDRPSLCQQRLLRATFSAAPLSLSRRDERKDVRRGVEDPGRDSAGLGRRSFHPCSHPPRQLSGRGDRCNPDISIRPC